MKNSLVGVAIKLVVLVAALYAVLSAMQFIREGGLNDSFSFLVPSNTLSTPEKELNWCSDFAIFKWKGLSTFVRENDKWILPGTTQRLDLGADWTAKLCKVKIQGFTLENGPPKDFTALLEVTDATGKAKLLEFSASTGVYRFDGLLFRSTDLAAALQQLTEATKKAGL